MLKDHDDYHDLYIQCDILLLVDAFENFRNKCIEIYELDPDNFLCTPGLAWQVCLKKTGIRLDSLTNHDMLLIFEKGTRGTVYQVTQRYAKANNKYLRKIL